MRPDGDVELDDTGDFVVAGCRDCGGAAQAGRGLLRRERARSTGSSGATPRSTRWPGRDGALLVAGSSLTVMSGFRFVRRAAKAGTPVVIVNRGETRGDELATYRLDAGTSEFLTALAARRRG